MADSGVWNALDGQLAEARDEIVHKVIGMVRGARHRGNGNKMAARVKKARLSSTQAIRAIAGDEWAKLTDSQKIRVKEALERNGNGQITGP